MQAFLVFPYTSKHQINAGEHGNKTFQISVNPACIWLPGYSTPTRAMLTLLNIKKLIGCQETVEGAT